MPIKAIYLETKFGWLPNIVISDASPWRLLCAALYDSRSGNLLLWSTYRLPYSDDVKVLISTILLIKYTTSKKGVTGPLYYQWVNDNSGAIAWA